MNSMIELKEGYWPINGTNVMVTSKGKINNLGTLIEENTPKEKEMVFIYNGNPFFSEETIGTAIDATKKYGAIIIADKSPDTLKIVKEDNFVDENQILNRDEYVHIRLRSMTYDFFKKRIMEPLMEHNIIKKAFDKVSKIDIIQQLNKEINRVMEIIPEW